MSGFAAAVAVAAMLLIAVDIEARRTEAALKRSELTQDSGARDGLLSKDWGGTLERKPLSDARVSVGLIDWACLEEA